MNNDDDLSVQLQQIAALMAYRDQLSAKLETAKAEIKKRELHAKAVMEGMGAKLFACEGVQAEIKSKRAYKPTDWPRLYAFIAEHGAFELLHKRLSLTALDEYSKQGALPPGVAEDSFDQLDVTPT